MPLGRQSSLRPFPARNKEEEVGRATLVALLPGAGVRPVQNAGPSIPRLLKSKSNSPTSEHDMVHTCAEDVGATYAHEQSPHQRLSLIKPTQAHERKTHSG